MKYLVMAYESADAFAARTRKCEGTYWEAWRAYSHALKTAGVLDGANRQKTQPPSPNSSGSAGAQSGRDAAAKDQLGGSFVIDVPDLDVALEWAARCPTAPDGAIEVRPLLDGSQHRANSALAGQPSLAVWLAPWSTARNLIAQPKSVASPAEPSRAAKPAPETVIPSKIRAPRSFGRRTRPGRLTAFTRARRASYSILRAAG
jgi:hypothetical protein